MPPRIARVPSMAAREDSHRTSTSPLGCHESTWAPKGEIVVVEEGTDAESVAMPVMITSEMYGWFLGK